MNYEQKCERCGMDMINKKLLEAFNISQEGIFWLAVDHNKKRALLIEKRELNDMQAESYVNCKDERCFTLYHKIFANHSSL